jgi:hypothetical protein
MQGKPILLEGKTMKEIPISKGFVTLVDDYDYEYLSGFKERVDERCY